MCVVEAMYLSIRRRDRYDVYRVLYEERMPPFVVSIAPVYTPKIPAGGAADTSSYIRELWTHDNELWVLEYEQPAPVFIGLGVGGVENRPWRHFRNIPDLYLPPRGVFTVSQQIAGGTEATLLGAASLFAEHVSPVVKRVSVSPAGASPACAVLKDVADGDVVGGYTVCAPAGEMRTAELEWPIRGVLKAVATANAYISVQAEWRPEVEKIVVGLGQHIWARVVNPTPQDVTRVALKLWGTRYVLKYVESRDWPEGEVVEYWPWRPE
jgi:hypothetical protein